MKAFDQLRAMLDQHFAEHDCATCDQDQECFIQELQQALEGGGTIEDICGVVLAEVYGELQNVLNDLGLLVVLLQDEDVPKSTKVDPGISIVSMGMDALKISLEMKQVLSRLRPGAAPAEVSLDREGGGYVLRFG